MKTKLVCLKVEIGKILGELPWKSKIPLQGNGMAAIPKINTYISTSKNNVNF